MKLFGIVLVFLLASTQAQAAEVRVITTGIFRGFFPDLVAQFERSSGHKVVVTTDTPFVVTDKLLKGFEADVVIAVTPMMKDIENSGKIVLGSRAAIGQVYVAAVVRAGALKPDLTTVDAAKSSIRSARVVAINDPKGGSNIGRFVMGLADKFSFDEELRSRFKLYPGGGNQVAEAVIKGEADFGITISSEILAVKGAEIAGPLPPGMNQINIAYGFLASNAKQVDAGTSFISFLLSSEARAVMASNGISSSTSALAEQLRGSWTLVASYQERTDGSRFDTFGPNPKGFMSFDGNGRMSLQMARSDRSKFASDSRLAGTAEENKAAVQGMLSYFGRYEVQDSDKAVVIQVDASSFPNQDGTTQKRPVNIIGDELKWTNPVPSRGEFSAAYIIWKRVR